ncbi:MAG: glycosyltransferase family 4 protein [Candidatus Xenobia bacterium]
MTFLHRYPIVAVLLVAWLFADVLTGLVRRVATRLGALDRPGGHKQHTTPTPTLGGVAVAVGFIAALYVAMRPDPVLHTMLWTAACLVLVGVVDDLMGVSALVKLGVLGALSACLVHAGITLEPSWPVWAGGLLTFLWIGFVSSAFNGVDNSDGAAGGLAVVVSGTVFAIAWASWQMDLAIVAAGTLGACLGFLRHNFNPAKIFLGDSGSFFLGYIISSLLVLGKWSNDPVKAALVAIAILGVPLFDFMLILVFRGLDGKYKTLIDPIVMCARDHTAHRLMALGLSVREAVLVLYLAGVLCSAVALQMFMAPVPQAIALFVRLLLGALAAATALRVAEVRRRRESRPGPEGLSLARPASEVVANGKFLKGGRPAEEALRSPAVHGDAV